MGGEPTAAGSVIHPLVRWLDDELGPECLERSLIVTTSGQAGASLGRALLGLRPGLLGVHFLTATGLARTVLQLLRAPQPYRLADPLLERELLRSCLGTGAVSSYANRYQKALHKLLSTVKELQRAAWPEPREALSPWGQEVWEIGQDYGCRDQRASRGRLMDLALQAMAGAELRGLPARVLVAGYPHREPDLDQLLERLEDRGVQVRLSPPTEERAAEVARFSAPDPGEELRLAASRCLRAAGDGIEFSAMVVAAPTLGPYVPHLRRAFGAEGVPFSAKAEGSLLHEPRAVFYRHAVSLLCEDGPRASYAALVSSRLRDPPEASELDRFERVSRELHLEGNASHLPEVLEPLQRELAGGAPRVLKILEDLVATARQPCATGAEQTRRLDRFARSLLAPAAGGRDAQVQERIQECLESLERALGGSMEPEAFARELHELFNQRGLPIASETGGGVTVVEYRNVLSFPAAHVHLLGLSADLVPGPTTGELLDESDREKLKGLVGRADALARQREILRRVLDHPSRSLVLSRSRSGEYGRATNPSPWLDSLLEERDIDIAETREPAHPQARADRRVESGLCPPDLALVKLALDGARLRDLVEVAGSGAAQWRHARKLERFRPQSLARDGHVGAELGASRVAEGLSVRDLEKLGGCPQQFLFERLMKLEPLPREPDPLDLRRDRLGSLIHGVLDDVQVEFREQMTSPKTRELGPRMVERAQGLLHERWQREARSLAPGIAVMHRLWEEQWAGALAEGIRADLGILEEEKRAPAEIEFELRETLGFSRPGGPQVSLELTGRPDRLDRSEAGERCVLDFKTGRRPTVLADPRAILSGRQLQLVLYGMMLESTGGGDPVSLEVRPLHPAALDEVGPRLQISADFTRGQHRQAMHETLAVLVELLLEGATVANVDNGPCAFCDFRLACRRLHPPSAERVRRTQMPEVRRYLALAGKSKRKPMLDPEEGACKS